MDNFRTRKGEAMNSLSVFTHCEIMEMENLIKHVAKQSLTQEFFQDLATSFSWAPIRAGKPDVTWEQVQSWFQDKQKELQAKSTSSPNTVKLLVDFSDSNVSRIPPQVSQEPKGKWVTELSELAFEAKSSKDDAWYDVATFLSYRVVSSGDLEVKVRFSGFGREEDEWVDVRGAVRERSIPLEASECPKVKVGDLVLCFQEREHQAVYCDAEVVVIHRGLHDMNGACKCTFVVRFDHDSSEEHIDLGRLCIRPAQSTSTNTKTQPELFRNRDMKISFLY
ncbi:protein SAWADEE HOMEODOMAIN HOMOLOG 1-like isoform X1 [Malus sylvestris]|uniref:protein SAWADEE HOMEODOMAIN HOMOLOG 1-like isoform X1 n=1 Tax=Malus sylvestris TaxID=3752 RepID=UPI0021AD0A58|nr:protein SAWADEE HOMEODOMAIN HOMOLOG 1-like isoform X1 [Malus sylvestris]